MQSTWTLPISAYSLKINALMLFNKYGVTLTQWWGTFESQNLLFRL